MIVSPPFSSSIRRVARWLALLVGAGALLSGGLAALMFFYVLPSIGEHRETVAQLMSRALGQRVTLDAVAGEWQQARPTFHLRGVRLHDRQGRQALDLPQLDAEFAWRSLLFLEPRFNRIDLRGLTLGVRRARDGHFYVGGIPVNPAAPDSGFSDWLLRQGSVRVSEARLTWLDEVKQAPPLVFSAVEFTLSHRFRQHRFSLRARPPADLAQPLVLDGRFHARRLDDPHTWSGQGEARLSGVAFARLSRWLALPYQPAQGRSALTLDLAVERGALARAHADFAMRDLETRLDAALPPLRLAQARGQARWQRGAGGGRLTLEGLRVALPGRPLGEPFSAGLEWRGDRREITARSLRLDGWQPLLPSLPLDAALRARLLAAQPQGLLHTLRLGWRGAQPGPDNFSLDVRFSGLGLAASGRQPGLAGLSGQIGGDARGGRFALDAPRAVFDLPALFREPRFEFDQIAARGSWKKTARGRLVELDDLRFANPDAAGSASGRYEQVAGQPGIIDLTARLTRADGRAVYRYLPKSIGDHTVAWVRDAVLAGRSDDVRLVLRGDLAKFPFERGDGAFSVDARIRDAVIDYVPGWPRIDGIEARMLFQGKSMEVTSDRAQISGAALRGVRARIPDLMPLEKSLLVNGEANGATQDFIRFANASPVGRTLRGLTDGISGQGPMRLLLSLNVPLLHSRDSTLAGRLAFLGGSLARPGLPSLEQVRGEIEFTERGLSARAIGAELLGGPVRIDVVNQASAVQVTAQGTATAAGMAPWLGAGWGRRLAGQAAWRGRIDLLPQGEQLRIESDLAGLASSLPAPLGKPAAQPLAFVLSGQTLADGAQREVKLGSLIDAVWRSHPDGRFARGEVRFGEAAALPAEPGLRVVGSGRGLDLSGWAALLPKGEAGEAALPLSLIDLRFDTFDLAGRRFQDVRLQGRNRAGQFRAQVSGRELNGVLSYRPAGAQPARVTALFKQLTVPDAAPAAAGGAPDGAGLELKAADFPQMELTVEDFRLQARALGRLEIVAQGAPQGLVFDKLQLTHPDSVFRMSGVWHDGGLSETQAELSLSVQDAGKMLTRFGYADTLKRGRAEIHGSARWSGSPADFGFSSLAGQVDFKAEAGQFLKINPGAGKLLGVLSLQSLPRRLSFDFRDIFDKGYAFDDIGATLRIARGVVYSDDFRMKGPAAKVNMSGLADLNRESVQLRIKVIPKLSEGVAVAGALIGGPLAGVGVLAAQKLLQDPIEEASSQNFMVTGSWLAPEVARLNRVSASPQADNP
jgi:uncharacterized protein (TIGR02099 family)